MAENTNNGWRHAGHDFTDEQLDWMEERGFSFFTAMDSAGTEGIMGPHGTIEYRDGAWEGHRRVRECPYGGGCEFRKFDSIKGAILWANEGREKDKAVS